MTFPFAADSRSTESNVDERYLEPGARATRHPEPSACAMSGASIEMT
jgi:hypothetical protein